MHQNRVPGIIIAGVQKCGTSSLFQALLHHPLIEGPQPQGERQRLKELHFFSTPRRYQMGWNWYTGHFAPTHTIKMEATPDYVARPSSLEKMRKHLPDAQIIVILRDPLDRAISAWQHWVRLPPDKRWRVPFPDRSFVENVEAEMRHFLQTQKNAGFIGRGFYEMTLRHLHQCYPKEQTHVLFLEDLVAQPEKELSALCARLGLPGHSLPFPKINVQRASKPLEIPDHCLHALWRIYHAHNKKLEHYLGRKTPWSRTWQDWSSRASPYARRNPSPNEHARFFSTASLVRLWASTSLKGRTRLERLHRFKKIRSSPAYTTCVAAAFSAADPEALLETDAAFSDEELLAASRAILASGQILDARIVGHLNGLLRDAASKTALFRFLIEMTG